MIFLNVVYKLQDIPTKLPEFYQNIMIAWFNLKNEPSTTTDIKREIIWFNKYIKVNNSTIYNAKCYANGLRFINDIIDITGNFISYNMI